MQHLRGRHLPHQSGQAQVLDDQSVGLERQHHLERAHDGFDLARKDQDVQREVRAHAVEMTGLDDLAQFAHVEILRPAASVEVREA